MRNRPQLILKGFYLLSERYIGNLLVARNQFKLLAVNREIHNGIAEKRRIVNGVVNVNRNRDFTVVFVGFFIRRKLNTLCRDLNVRRLALRI